MGTYNRNSKISDLKVQSFQSLELRCPTANCRKTATLPIDTFSDDLTLEIIHWTTACSACGRSDVYATPILAKPDEKASDLPAIENSLSGKDVTQLVKSRIVELCKRYPAYVSERAKLIARDEFARNPERNWNDLATSEQADIIANLESKIRDGHIEKVRTLGLRVLPMLGLPMLI